DAEEHDRAREHAESLLQFCGGFRVVRRQLVAESRDTIGDVGTLPTLREGEGDGAVARGDDLTGRGAAAATGRGLIVIAVAGTGERHDGADAEDRDDGDDANHQPRRTPLGWGRWRQWHPRWLRRGWDLGRC